MCRRQEQRLPVVVSQAEFLVHPAAGAWSVHGADDVKLSLVTLQLNSRCGVEVSTICAKASEESLLAKCIKVSIYVNSPGWRTRESS